MHFTSVDLPAPFSPRSAWNVPAPTLIDTSSSAVNGPKRIVMSTVSTPSAPDGGGSAPMTVMAAPRSGVALSDTAPNTPPCIFTILIAATWLPRSVAPQQSSSTQAFEAAVVRLAHRGVHADVRGDAGQDQVRDAPRAQDQFEVGRAERALAGLVDDDLARQRGRAPG